MSKFVPQFEREYGLTLLLDNPVLQLAHAKHDVSGEKRDKHGRWTSGGSSSKKRIAKAKKAKKDFDAYDEMEKESERVERKANKLRKQGKSEQEIQNMLWAEYLNTPKRGGSSSKKRIAKAKKTNRVSNKNLTRLSIKQHILISAGLTALITPLAILQGAKNKNNRDKLFNDLEKKLHKNNFDLSKVVKPEIWEEAKKLAEKKKNLKIIMQQFQNHADKYEKEQLKLKKQIKFKKATESIKKIAKKVINIFIKLKYFGQKIMNFLTRKFGRNKPIALLPHYKL